MIITSHIKNRTFVASNTFFRYSNRLAIIMEHRDQDMVAEFYRN
jgi:hypothetical protein